MLNDVVTAPSLTYRSNDVGKTAWYSYAWDSFGKPQEERNFIVKLDLSLLVFSVLGLLMRYIDQKNVDSAYVSGMREELKLYGNELNYAQTCWTVGYVIGQVPVNVLLNRISPHYIIFALEMGWTLLTLCTTWAHSATHLYVIRFFVGLFESGYYPGLLFLIGSWYTKDELAKRSNIFQAATAGGTLLCGLIQGGIYSSLNGKGGYSGWRWCFAIDALISFPIAVGAFFMIPDLPTVIKPNWLFSERDIEIGKARMLAAGREGPKPGSFNFPFFVNLLSEWHIWFFTTGYSLYIYSQNPQQSMSFWLKYSKNPTYTVPQINYYPSGIWATQIVSALGFSWLSDTVLKGRRWPPLIFVTVWHLIDVAVLAATPVYAKNRAPRWVFYYLSGLVNCTPGLFYAWCSEIAGASSERRGVIMGTFNSVAYSFNAWLPLLLFKTSEQPRVLKGNISVVVAQVLLIGVLLAILQLSKRDKREAKKAQDD